VADTRRQRAGRKRQVLLDLQQRQRALLAAGSSTEYALLLVEAELVQIEIQQQEYLQETRLWFERYREFTGLRELPADIQEPAPPLEALRPNRHPQVQALELAHRQQLQLLRANSQQAADWTVALKAKNLDSDGYNEQQYGLGVEIPLSLFSVASQADSTEWRSAEREYLLARDQLLAELDASWQRLLNEREMLTQKAALLSRSEVLKEHIATQLAQLQASNEVEQEMVLRRTLESIDTSAELAVTRLLLEQNNVMLRQAAGLSL